MLSSSTGLRLEAPPPSPEHIFYVLDLGLGLGPVIATVLKALKGQRIRGFIKRYALY